MEERRGRYQIVFAPQLVECPDVDRGKSASNELYVYLHQLLQHKFNPNGCMPQAVEKMKRIQDLISGLKFVIVTKRTRDDIAEIGRLIDEMMAFPDEKVVSWLGTACLEMKALFKIMKEEAGM